MVTPEMLRWLAGKIFPGAEVGEEGGAVWYSAKPDDIEVFNPHTDYAQFGRLVVWALQEDIKLERVGCEIVALHYSEYRVDHDSTPDSIRAAAVVAICGALGWPEK